MKQRLPNVTKIYYVSDGCGGQHKNFKNFLNICSHKEDFSIEAEWIFFATSHRKSWCDGIGGAVECHAEKRFEDGNTVTSKRSSHYSFPSQHHKLDTNCAVRITRLWTSMTSKFQLELILVTLHHHLTSLACTIPCGGLVW